MAAVLALPSDKVQQICEEAAQGEVSQAANLNSPEQTVISGDAAAVKRAVELASASGAKRAVMLPVSAPFHSELMAPAREKLETDLRNVTFEPLPVYLFAAAVYFALCFPLSSLSRYFERRFSAGCSIYGRA